MRKTALWCALALGTMAGVTGCEERTPAEKIEDAAEDMGDAMGDAVGDAAEDAADAVEDAVDKD